ncbi:MAG TPA: FAD-dependent oxidoreductase [Pilimelia sp.]|nr:FAD-dependent oxidoreductase [Pilimelia sp.]
MSHTPLLRALLRAAGQVDAAAGPRPPVSRRTLLKGSAVGAGSLAGLGAYTMASAPASHAAKAPSTLRVAVIGGGLAGLTAAYRLKVAGHTATVYEAAGRVGGRCWTDRGTFGGQTAERGGELIDSSHKQLRGLITELGLQSVDLLRAEPAGSAPIYHFDGAVYDQATAQADLTPVVAQARRDAAAAGFPTLYNSFTARGQQLDRMSIRDWINAYVPGGIASRVGQLLDIAYTIEYGAETSQQAALNLIYLFGYQNKVDIQLFGPSDEKFAVRGGNDQVATALAARLPGQVRLGTELRALARRTDGTWAVTVGPAGGGGTASTVVADRVVLALPFSTLRRVDLTGAGFPARKLQAIRELQMGTNSKLHLQFSSRLWYERGCNGETYADTGYQNTWEVTRGQAGTPGILVDYTGGRAGADFGTLTPAAYARRFLGQLEPVLPGITAKWNGKVLLDNWTTYPWTRGSYSYYGVGQYTTITGVEREAVNGCHFAGEHTSIDFQGYLNGAVETGERAAREIIAAVR